MSRALPVLGAAAAIAAVSALVAFVSGLVAYVVATGIQEEAPQADTSVRPTSSPVVEVADGEPTDVTDLRMQVAMLEGRVAELEAERGVGARISVAPPGEAAADAGLFAASLSQLDVEGERAFRDQVTRVLEELEEEKQAEEREREMEERAKEAAASYEEYDEVDRNLDESVATLGQRLGFDSGRMRDMKSLLAVQNERNREMTRMWASGKVSDEELGEIFMENRAKHRAEVTALVGRANLPRFKKFVQDGGLGGRFSFFTAPWENWTEGEPGR